MHTSGGASQPASVHVTPILYGTAWNHSVHASHADLIRRTCKKLPPHIDEVLRLALPNYLGPPHELKSVQILALPERKSATTEEVIAFDWYTGHALRLQLPGELTTIPLLPRASHLRKPCMCADGQWIVCGTDSPHSTNCVIHMIDGSTDCVTNYILPDAYGAVVAMACSQDKPSLAIAQEWDQLKVWKWSPWVEEHIPIQDIDTMAIAPSGNLLAVWHEAYDSAFITIVMLKSGNDTRSTPVESDAFMHYGAVHPQEENVVFVGKVGHDAPHAFLLLFDIRFRKVKHRMELKNHRWVRDVVYDPAGRFVVMCSERGVDTVDVESGRMASLFSEKPMHSITYTPSGDYLVASNQYEVLLCHTTTVPYIVERLPVPWKDAYHILGVRQLRTPNWQPGVVNEK